MLKFIPAGVVRLGFLHRLILPACRRLLFPLLIWSENGYKLCPFWSGIGYDFRGGLYEHIYHFNSKWVRKKEKSANSKWILRNLLCWCSYLSIWWHNLLEAPAYRPGLKTGVKNDTFWSEIGSEFAQPDGTLTKNSGQYLCLRIIPGREFIFDNWVVYRHI